MYLNLFLRSKSVRLNKDQYICAPLIQFVAMNHFNSLECKYGTYNCLKVYTC